MPHHEKDCHHHGHHGPKKVDKLHVNHLTANCINLECCDADKSSIQCNGVVHFKDCDGCGCKNSFTLDEKNYYIIKVGYDIAFACPVASGTMYINKISPDQKTLASNSAISHVADCVVFEGLLEAGTVIQIVFDNNDIPLSKACINIFISKNDQTLRDIELLEDTTAFDVNVNTNNCVQWIPFAPPRPPQPPVPVLPEVAKQYPSDLDYYLWFSNVIPWKQNQQDNCPVDNPNVPPGLESRFSPFFIQSYRLPNSPPNQSTVQANTFGYDNFGSLPASIFYFLGLRLPKASPGDDDTTAINLTRTSPENTIFARGVEDRGPNNNLKRKYMWALRTALMEFYTEKVDLLAEEIYTKVVVNGDPLLSSVQDSVVKFFLSIHIGVDPEGYPDYVVEYFKRFIRTASFADNQRPETPSVPSRDQDMRFGFETAPRIKEYFAKRVAAVTTRDGGSVESGDTTTLAYWWVESGLPPESLLIECVHNVNAFNQFTHIFFILAADWLWANDPPAFSIAFPNPPSTLPSYVPNDFVRYPVAPSPPLLSNPPPTGTFSPQGAVAQAALNYGPTDFFKKMREAVDNGSNYDRLNVVRELYRMTVPVGTSFSSVRNVDSPDSKEVQSRHVHKAMMIIQEGNTNFGILPTEVPKFFQFNPDRYNGYQTSVDEFQPNSEPETTGLIKPEDGFVTSPVDCQTVVDKYNQKVQPVLENPIPGQNNDAYIPFGLGNRRCAGEIFVYLVTEKLLKRFSKPFNVAPPGQPEDLKTFEWDFRPFVQDPADPFTGTVTNPDSSTTKAFYIGLSPFVVFPNNIYVKKNWDA